MSEPVIVARGLSRRFGDLIAVRDVSFEVGVGEILLASLRFRKKLG